MQETSRIEDFKKTRGAKKMTIQKKSLINSLNTTKKALVASTPVAGSAAEASVKPGVTKLGTKKLAVAKLGTKRLAVAKFGTKKAF
jgi:hypothetical protein